MPSITNRPGNRISPRNHKASTMTPQYRKSSQSRHAHSSHAQSSHAQSTPSVGLDPSTHSTPSWRPYHPPLPDRSTFDAFALRTLHVSLFSLLLVLSALALHSAAVAAHSAGQTGHWSLMFRERTLPVSSPRGSPQAMPLVPYNTMTSALSSLVTFVGERKRISMRASQLETACI